MRITIAERRRPFSHVPGVYFVLPGTQLRFQLFPSLIRIHQLTEQDPFLVSEISLEITGPVRDFTAMQDLEKGDIRVWGHSAEGFFRYLLHGTNNNSDFFLKIEKQPQNKPLQRICSSGFLHQYGEELESKQKFLFSLKPDPSECTPTILRLEEKLSLGNHKAQDWDKMRPRLDMSEILPFWIRLGQITPPSQGSSVGTAALLNPIRNAIDDRALEKILPAFQNLFLAGFDPGLSPRLLDTQHHGFHLPSIKQDDKISPLYLLTEGANLIRKLFLQVEGEQIKILPALPPQFHCGRFLHLHTPAGILDIEWSKKEIRKIILKATKTGEGHFIFQKGLKSFRLRQKKSEKGEIHACNTPISILEGNTYFIDQFC